MKPSYLISLITVSATALLSACGGGVYVDQNGDLVPYVYGYIPVITITAQPVGYSPTAAPQIPNCTARCYFGYGNYDYLYDPTQSGSLIYRCIGNSCYLAYTCDRYGCRAA